MISFDALMILVNVSVSLRAVFRVLRARRRLDGSVDRSVHVMLAITAAFAVLYAVSYIVILLAGPEYRLTWSRVMVTVSPFVWWYVWPALADAATEFQTRQAEAHQALVPKLEEARSATEALCRAVDKVA